MGQKTTSQASSSSQIWERWAAFVRAQVQRFIQALLEEASTERWGRPTSARRAAVDAPQGMRNGDGKPRRLRLTSGTITGRRPRVRGLRERFISRVWPLVQRRTRQVGALWPPLSWHGLALGDFELARRGRLGEGAPLSAAALARLKASWSLAYDAWTPRRQDDLAVVYVWADGLYVKAGLEDRKAALLVLIGALTDGQKVVLAVESGPRESTASGGAVLRDRRAQGLKPWRGTIAAGHWGIWAALAEQQPTAAAQRGWNHRLVNVLDAIPKQQQAQARTLRCAMPYAESQEACERLRAPFEKRSHPWAPNAVERLTHDWDRWGTF
jgi:putative transposase